MEAHRQASWFCSPRNRPGSVISATAFASIRLIVFYSCVPILCVHCTVSTGQFSPQCPRQVCFILTVPQLKGDCPWCPIAGGYAVFLLFRGSTLFLAILCSWCKGVSSLKVTEYWSKCECGFVPLNPILSAAQCVTRCYISTRSAGRQQIQAVGKPKSKQFKFTNIHVTCNVM